MIRPSVDIGGVPVLVSPLLPCPPSPGEQARRIVRHGMADVLAWLGEEVGPLPEAPIDLIVSIDPAGPDRPVIFVSQERYEQLRGGAEAA